MTAVIILLGIALLALLAVLCGPMILLYILGGLVFLVFSVMLIPITVDIKLEDELYVTLKTAFVKIKLTPRKEKPTRLSDFRIARFRKRRLKEQRKYLLSRPKKKKPEQTEAEKKAKEEKPKRSLKENVDYVLDLVKLVVLRAIKKFGKHLRISLYYLQITVGGTEPDKTAITYGYICQSIAYLTKIFDRHLNMKYPGKTENRIYVGADFSSPKTDVRLHIAFRIKVWHMAHTGLSALLGYMGMPKREPKKVIQKDPAKAGKEA